MFAKRGRSRSSARSAAVAEVVAEPRLLVGPEGVRVVVLTKPGCHLCDVARHIVELVCAERDLDHVEVDISADPFLLSEFADAIPVVLVDGIEVGRFRVAPRAIEAALDRR